MAVERSDDLVARVVAWHNRHPLARRIERAHVQSVGVMALPFRAGPDWQAPGPAAPQEDLAPAGGSLRERARSRVRERTHANFGSGGVGRSARVEPSARRGSPPPGRNTAAARPAAAFGDNPMAPASRRSLERWLRRHGAARQPGPADAPQRNVGASAVPPGTAVAPLWAFTAAVAWGAERRRVLVAADGTAAVFGQRLFSGERIAAFMLVVATAIAGAAWSLIGSSGSATGQSSMASAPKPAPPSAAALTPPLPVLALARPIGPVTATAPVAPTASVSSQAPAVPAAPAPTSAWPAPPTPMAAASQPIVVPPAQPKLGPRGPVLRPLEDSLRAEARRLGTEARAARAARNAQAAASAAASSTSPQAAASAPTAPTSAVNATQRGGQPAWAVSSRLLRTRFESEQMLRALRELAGQSARGDTLRLEVVSAGDDWRAVGFPFAEREQAERLRAALAARGLRFEVVPF